MFNPNNNQTVAPVTTPVWRVPANNETFTAYLADHRCNNSTTIATIGGMLIRLCDIVFAAGNDPLTNNVSNLFRPGAAAAILALAVAPQAAPANDDEENIVAARANVANCDNWFADLLNAAQKAPLTPGNVDGYFASFGHTGTSAGAVVWLINSMRPFFPDEVGNQAFRNLLTNNTWTTYRCARVSAGLILAKLLPDFRNLGITTANDVDEQAILASAAAPWDLDLAAAIGEKFKAYGCIYLEAAGIPLDKWVQGNKAMNALPASKVRGAKAICKRYLEVKNDITNLAQLNTVAAISQDNAIANF